MRVSVGWAVLGGAVPLYPLYALLFADTGLSDAEISALFALWSTVGFLAEVPSGVLADRLSRRGALVAAGVLEAAGFALWTALPGLPAFAAGFVLWGLGGALVSGALEALLYDGLVVAGVEGSFARVLGSVRAAGLLAQLVAAAAATVLFSLGGYPLVGWASVTCCRCGAALAARLPEPPRERRGRDADAVAGYLCTLRTGLAEAARQPAVRMAVLAVAALGGVDAIEEYLPLLARDWGVPTPLIPLAGLGIPLAGAAGAALAGAGSRARPTTLALAFGVAVLALAAADVVRQPVGLVGAAVFYGLYRLVLVAAETRLQRQIDGPSRATVTSVAGLGTELACFLIYGAWSLGRVTGVICFGLLLAAALPSWLHARHTVEAAPGLPLPRERL